MRETREQRINKTLAEGMKQFMDNCVSKALLNLDKEGNKLTPLQRIDLYQRLIVVLESRKEDIERERRNAN